MVLHACRRSAATGLVATSFAISDLVPTLCRFDRSTSDSCVAAGRAKPGMTGDRRGGNKKKTHTKLHGWRPSRQISSHSLQVHPAAKTDTQYEVQVEATANPDGIHSKSIKNPSRIHAKFIKIQTESLKNPLEIAAESIQNPHGTNAKSKATFAYPSRAFH